MNSNNIKKIVSAMLIIAISIVFTACVKSQGERIEEKEIVTENEGISYIEIQTQYMTLYLNDEMKEEIFVEVEENDIESKISFCGVRNDKKILLYTIYFGGADGFPIGTFTVEEKFTIDVTAKLEELEKIAEGEELDEYCALQESFNNVLKEMGNNPGFVLIK